MTKTKSLSATDAPAVYDTTARVYSPTNPPPTPGVMTDDGLNGNANPSIWGDGTWVMNVLTGAGWPAAVGMVVTSKSGSTHVVQNFYSGGNIWTRLATSATAWSSWVPFTDSGWVNIAAAGSMTRTYQQYKIRNGFVHVKGNMGLSGSVSVSTTGGITDQLFGTLPASAWPANHHFTTFWVSAALQGIGYISAVDGGIRLQACDARGTAYTLSAGAAIQWSTSYPLEF